MSQPEKKINKNLDRMLTVLAIFGMISSAIIGSFLTKAQYETVVAPCKGCPPTNFNHPYMTTVMMFISEFTAIFIWLPQYFCAKKKGIVTPLRPGKKYFKFIPHTFLFMVPTLCDLLASTIVNIALFFTLTSIVTMIRQAVVLFVAIFSAAAFKSYRHSFDLPQGIGLLLLTIGCVVISYASAFMGGGTQGQGATNNVLGVIMAIIGTALSALFFVIEEIFLRGVEMEATLAVANEGAWGLLFHAILMPIYEHVDDPFSTEVPKPKMENCYAWYYQSSHSGKIIALIVAQWALTMIYNVAGCEITNRVASATRTTFDTIKVIFVWIISIIIKWEYWNNTSSPVRLVGFILLTLGVFLYNNVTQWMPFLKPHNIEKYGKVGTQCKNCCKKKTQQEAVQESELVVTQAHPIAPVHVPEEGMNDQLAVLNGEVAVVAGTSSDSK